MAEPTDVPPSAPVASETALFEARLQAMQDSAQRDIQHLNSRLDMQDKWFADQNAHVGHVLGYLNIFLATLAIVLTLAGVLGYVSMQSRAQREAEDAASAWFEKHAKDMDDRLGKVQADLEVLEQRSKHAHGEIGALTQAVRDEAESAKQQIRLQLAGQTTVDAHPSAEGAAALEQLARSLKEKPEVAYTFQDWSDLAYAAFQSGDKEGAVRFWGAAAQKDDAKPEDVARILVGQGSTLGQLKRFEDEIAVYDEVMRRFGGASGPALRVPVANALVNKGITLVQLGRPADAIAVYDEVIRRFGEAAEAAEAGEAVDPVLLELAGKARTLRQAALEQLGRGDGERE